MLPVSAVRAINLRRVVYITITPPSVLVHLDTGEKIPVPGPFTANVDLEEEFQKARIAVIVYSTNNGSKTLIGSAYILEIVEVENVTTYKMVGGATLQIRGGGDLVTHLRTVKDAEDAAARVYSPVISAVIGHSVDSLATNDPFVDIVFANNATPIENVAAAAMVYPCAFCGVGCEGRRCMGCKSARYCSSFHQKLHWDGGHWEECVGK